MVKCQDLSTGPAPLKVPRAGGGGGGGAGARGTRTQFFST